MMLAHALALGAGGRVRYTPTDAGAAAYIAAMTTAPTDQRKQQIDTLFASLRSTGVLAKLSHLYLLAAHDAQAARLNAVNPGTNNLSAANSPTFTADRGYQGDGSSSYLETGYAITAQDSAHIGLWSRTSAQGAGVDMGSQNSLILARSTTDQTPHRVNASGSDNASPVTDGTGHFLSNRTGAAVNDLYSNGAKLLAGTRASIAPGASTIRVCGRSGSVSFSARQLATAHVGAGLTDTDVSNLYSALNTYMQAVGAA